MLQNFALFFLLLSCNTLFAQTQQKEAEVVKTTEIKKVSNPSQEQVLDTKESLSYMGDRLLFQVRKRLHLTTEEEEKKEEEILKKQKKVKLSIGGVTIER